MRSARRPEGAKNIVKCFVIAGPTRCRLPIIQTAKKWRARPGSRPRRAGASGAGIRQGSGCLHVLFWATASPVRPPACPTPLRADPCRSEPASDSVALRVPASSVFYVLRDRTMTVCASIVPPGPPRLLCFQIQPSLLRQHQKRDPPYSLSSMWNRNRIFRAAMCFCSWVMFGLSIWDGATTP